MMQLLHGINPVLNKLRLNHGDILILMDFQRGMKHWRVSILAGNVLLAMNFGFSRLANKE